MRSLPQRPRVISQNPDFGDQTAVFLRGCNSERYFKKIHKEEQKQLGEASW